MANLMIALIMLPIVALTYLGIMDKAPRLLYFSGVLLIGLGCAMIGIIGLYSIFQSALPERANRDEDFYFGFVTVMLGFAGFVFLLHSLTHRRPPSRPSS